MNWTVAALFLMVGAGCHRHRPVDPASAPSTEPVRIHLAPPQDLVIRRTRGDTVLLRGVTVVEGSLAAVRGDTMMVRPLIVARTAQGRWDDEGREGASVTVIRDTRTEVAARQFVRPRLWVIAAWTGAALVAAYVAFGALGGFDIGPY